MTLDVTSIVCGCTLVQYMRSFLPFCLQTDSDGRQRCYSIGNEIWSKEGREGEVRQYLETSVHYLHNWIPKCPTKGTVRQRS